MTVDDWLRMATQQLTSAGIDSARLDALILLEDLLQVDRAHLLAHPEISLIGLQLEQLDESLRRRAVHEPLAYIRGFREFYGRRFSINSDVLVPRPESESMITLLLQIAPQAVSVADIGTGSGCLAVTAALEIDALTYAVDIDEACLAIARQNAVVHTASVEFLKGDLLAPILDLPSTPEVLLANLPYVPENYAINEAARHEPANALFAGTDGLDLYRRMALQLDSMAPKPNLIITEALLSQHDALAALMLGSGYHLETTDGLAQAFKITRGD